MTQRGYWREADGSPITIGEALAAWATETLPVLEKVAGTYQALITYDDLAEIVQGAAGVRTTAAPRQWIGRVLDLVAQECHRRGDPPLTALVVSREDGRVGDQYRTVLQITGAPAIHDDVTREWHAAAARLACYRHFGAALPDDGGEPALSPLFAELAPLLPPTPEPAAPATRATRQPAAPRSAAPRSATPRVAKPKKAAPAPPKPAAVCPNCFMQLPATGVCDSCA